MQGDASRQHIIDNCLYLSVNQSTECWEVDFYSFILAIQNAAKTEVKWRIMSHRVFQESIRLRWNFRFSETYSLSNDISEKIEQRWLSILYSETEFEMPNYGSFWFELTWNNSKLKKISLTCRLKAHWHWKSIFFSNWLDSLDAVTIVVTEMEKGKSRVGRLSYRVLG